MIIQNLFPTGILYHKVNSNISNYVENLVVKNLNKLQQTDTLKTDFFNGNRIISLDEIPSLMQEIKNCITYYSNKIKISIPLIKDYWIQDYSKNEYHNIHNHGRCELSLIYWIRANQYAGGLKIYNPSPYNKIYYHNDKKSIYTQDNIIIPPCKGGIVIFPSFLEHEVLPSEKNCVRTTLAINYINSTIS